MRILGLALAATVGLTGAAFAADPAVGVWKTEVDDGAYAYIKVVECGAKLCGTIHKTFNASGPYKSENLGKRLLWDMAPEGNGKYSSDKSGKIWRPSNGKVYKSKMALKGNNKLVVQGCVGPICPRQNWSRVN